MSFPPLYLHPYFLGIVSPSLNAGELISIAKALIGNKDIKKYINKANSDYASGVYKSYDEFINTKYKIDINEKVLERLKNSF